MIWQIAARRSTYEHLSKRSVLYKARRKGRTSISCERQFGYVKPHFRGLAKNTAQLNTLFALSSLWMYAGNYCLVRERCAREGR